MLEKYLDYLSREIKAIESIKLICSLKLFCFKDNGLSRPFKLREFNCLSEQLFCTQWGMTVKISALINFAVEHWKNAFFFFGQKLCGADDVCLWNITELLASS